MKDRRQTSSKNLKRSGGFDKIPQLAVTKIFEQKMEPRKHAVSRLTNDKRSPEARDRGKLALDVNISKSVLANLLSSRPEVPYFWVSNNLL